MKYLLILSFFLISACGGSNSSQVNQAPPSVEAVSITGSGLTDTPLTGSYRFNDIGNDGDASDTYWLHPNGSTIAKGTRLVPNDSLVGWSIRFCVKAISAGRRLEGNLVCSDEITITEPRILVTPKISIVNQSTNTKVGATLSALATEDYDYSISYHWYINDQEIAGEATAHLVLNKAWQGQRAHVCIKDSVSKNVLACTKKTNFIQARSSYAPQIEITPLPSHIAVGSSLQADYNYSDKDNDEEDTSRLTYRWYIDDQLASSEQNLIINEKNALSELQLCITAYSKTGLPDSSEQQCLSSQTIWQSTSKVPEITAINIQGIAIKNYKIAANYHYFDANNHIEANSDSGWFANDKKITHSAELLLTEDLINNAPYVEYCVTPKDNSGASGLKTCQRQGFAEIETKGALQRGSKLIPKLTNFPDFHQSWWRTVGDEYNFKHFFEIGDNEFKPWLGSSYNPSITVNYQELAFCILTTKLDGNEAEICTPLSRDNGLTLGVEVDKDNLQRVGFDPMPEIEVSLAGKNYKVYRPISAAEYSRLADSLNLNSAETTSLGNLTSIKMTPAEALSFCQRTKVLGQLASRDVINHLFLQRELSAFVLWPNPYNVHWLAANNQGLAVTLSEFQTLDSEKKYPFNCMSPL